MHRMQLATACASPQPPPGGPFLPSLLLWASILQQTRLSEPLKSSVGQPHQVSACNPIIRKQGTATVARGGGVANKASKVILVILTALLCILPAVSRHRLGKPSAVHLVHPHRLKHASGQRNIQHALPRVTPSQPPPHCLLPLAYKPPAAVRQWAGIFHAFAEKRKWTGDFGWSVNVLEKE